MCMLLAFNVYYKLTTVFVIRAVPKMVSPFVCNQRGFPYEVDELNADDRIHWKCHIHLSEPWAGFKPVTSEITLPALFALL